MLKIRISLAALVLAATSSISCRAQENQEYLSQVCVVQSPKINENSGVDTSQAYKNAIWTHNDSGNDPIVFLFSQTTGKTLAELTIVDCKNADWEDICSFQSGEQGYLLIADVGDNKKKRDWYQLCIFPEPELELSAHDSEEPDIQRLQLRQWKDLRFKYEDGSHNCEAVVIDMAAKKILLLEKVLVSEDQVPGVYQIELPEEKTDDLLVAKRIADIPYKNITGMDLSADGTRIVVRTYVDGFLYSRTEGESWAEVFAANKPKTLALPLQRQGEGVCFSLDEKSVILSSEKKRAPLWRIKLKENQ